MTIPCFRRRLPSIGFRFPDFVRYAVQRIKLFCPSLGNVKIAEMLARAGIHIGKTTVARILNEKPAEAPEPSSSEDTGKCSRIVVPTLCQAGR